MNMNFLNNPTLKLQLNKQKCGGVIKISKKHIDPILYFGYKNMSINFSKKVVL